jgi:hypothetical protein
MEKQEKDNSEILNELKEKNEKVQEKKLQESKEIAKKIQIDSSGEMQPKTFEEQQVMAFTYLRSKMLPASFDTVEKVLTGMQFVSELGLKSLTALRQTYIVNGTPNLFGDLPLALARRTGKLEYFEEFLFNDKLEKICLENKNINDPVYGAVCRITRKGEATIEKIFTVADAVTAGLFLKDDKGNFYPNPKKDTWCKYPKIMLMYRARAAALKVAFADILNGVGILEYDTDIIGDIPESDKDPEKENLLDEIMEVLSECRKLSGFNKAQEDNLINRYIENQDIRFAGKDSLQKLNQALREYFTANDKKD